MATDSTGLGDRDSAALSRRSFFGAAAAGVGLAVGAPAFLAACGGGSAAQGGANSGDLSAVLPKYAAGSGGPAPDLPSVTGKATASTDPGFLTYPTDLVKTVPAVPGAGGSYKAITPIWGPLPKPGNSYYQAVNRALGASLTMAPADGNSYAQTVPTLVAGNKLPDWIQIPTWWNANINVGGLAVNRFADLTDHLAGDKIGKYPHLAAIPTGGWQAGAWQNRLYGIPSFTSQANFSAALFYRQDLLAAKGIRPDSVTSADSLLALGKELTSATANVWAFDVLWLSIQQMFKVPPLSTIVSVRDGKAVSGFDSPELEAALAFAYKLAKSGYVHPEALAGNDADGKQRFYSGKVVITSDGTGAWNAQDALAGLAANPKYRRGAFTVFSADGSQPSIALANSATIVSYLNKKLSPAQIDECLAIANYLAAPYGSAEYTLINYGVEGEHWTMEKAGPTRTTQGTKDANQNTYQFLASYRNVVTNPGYDSVTQDAHAWAADAVQHAYKPAFWNLNVNTPAQFSSISTGTQVNDVIKQVTYGKKTVAEFKAAAATWKTSGGQRLVDWYQKEVVDKYGTGQ
jgi:putative aldouronate transport system substrate-binding protein